MFNLADYPAQARRDFVEAPILWPAAVTHAFEGGVRDVNKLTNLVFYMHHRERVSGGVGEPLAASERDFEQLATEWKAFKTVVQKVLKGMSHTTPGSSTAGSGTLAQDFTDFVKRVRRAGGRSLSAADEKALTEMVAPLSAEDVKTLEWILVLWPTFGASAKMNRMTDIVTAAVRKTDKRESARGRFEEAEGGAIKRRLSKAAKETAFGQCLNFLVNEGLSELYAGQETKVAAAISRYVKVAAERKKKRQAHGGGTLSILASEMRLEGLVGPINILEWKGSADKGHHDPNPVELFDRLSSAGDGWYFFLASAVSFHTFLIAVHVTSAGASRSYFEIQDGQSVRKTPAQLKAWFDDEFSPNTKLASSRVWQVYRRPAD
jgi:hypothetical protein